MLFFGPTGGDCLAPIKEDHLKLVITGGRKYDDYVMFEDVLDLFKPTEIYVGDCPTGADRLAREYAEYHDIMIHVYEADWDKYGKSAGPIRNRQMLAAAGPAAIVVAFPGGKGTANCVETAVGFNMIVLEVK